MPVHETASVWDAMGGSVGDGSINNLAHTQAPPNPSGMVFSNHQSPNPQYLPSVGAGSITRFASPETQQPQQLNTSSYSTRSQQAMEHYQHVPVGQASYTHAPRSEGPVYAVRSQQAYGQIQQVQQTQQFSQSQPTGSQHVNPYGFPQTQPSFQANISHVTSIGSPASMPMATQTLQPSTATQNAAPGSYAARSAQNLYGTTPQQSHVATNNFSGSQQQTTSSGSSSHQQNYGMQQQYSSQQHYVAQQPYGSQQPYSAQQMQQSHISQQQVSAQMQQPVTQQQQQNYGQQVPVHPVSNAYGGSNNLPMKPHESPQFLATQQRILAESTRKIQEHVYYMKQAMEQNNLSIVLDRAAHMVGELGGPPHGQQHYQQQQLQQQQQNNSMNPNAGLANSGGASNLTPKNYYDLYMRALEELPTFEEYLMNLTGAGTTNNPLLPDGHIRIVDTSIPQQEQKKYSMRELYDFVQFCPRVVSRLYLQIAAGSALIRSGEAGAKFVLQELRNALKCEQNPIRGLFVRHYLITALKDKLPTAPPPAPEIPTEMQHELGDEQSKSMSDIPFELEAGTVKDSYEFILSNFMEMNKLWVRIQYLPGEGKNKDVRKRRERERNDLRILVGTNLVRLSQLESVTSKIYGEVILPQILEHIVVAGDPLSQAYLMDCLVQVFPDEYHIETLPVLLNVCPRLRDKVNVRTILQGLMDRLANYLADEELLDESDTNEVKKTLARDSFGMFEECVSAVYNARGPKLTSREVIRLQTALLQFSTKCFSGNLEQVSICLSSCLSALRQANASYEFHDGTVVEVPQEKVVMKPLDDVSVVELEKLLSLPLSTLAIRVLQFDDYHGLVSFLPWANRREIAVKMLEAAVRLPDSVPRTVPEIMKLLSVIEPLLRDEYTDPSRSPQAPDPMAAATLQMAGMGFNPSGQLNPPIHVSAVGMTNMRCYTADQLHKVREDNALVCKLLHLLSENENLNDVYDILKVMRDRIVSATGSPQRLGQILSALVFASVRLCCRAFDDRQSKEGRRDFLSKGLNSQNGTNVQSVKQNETVPSQKIDDDALTNKSVEGEEIVVTVGNEKESATTETLVVHDIDSSILKESSSDARNNCEQSDVNGSLSKVSPALAADDDVSCRKLFVFIQETIAEISKFGAERSFKMYLEMSTIADSFVRHAEAPHLVGSESYVVVCVEFLNQAFSICEERIIDSKVKFRCIVCIVGTLLSLKSLSSEQYESFTTKTAQYSAKMTKKQEQCQLVALCAHLFYPVRSSGVAVKYSNPQRALECLQRCLKLADACTNSNPAHVTLFVDLLEHYVFFFEKGNPSVAHTYISGLIALIKEHLNSLVGSESLSEAKEHFQEIIRYILRKKAETDSPVSQLFAPVNLG